MILQVRVPYHNRRWHWGVPFDSHDLYVFCWFLWQSTPPKIHILNLQDGGLEDDFPCQWGDFQVPAVNFQGCRPSPLLFLFSKHALVPLKLPPEIYQNLRRSCSVTMVYLGFASTPSNSDHKNHSNHHFLPSTITFYLQRS